VQHLKLLACALLLPLLGACATSGARRGFEALPLLPPAAFGAEATGVQRLTVSRLSAPGQSGHGESGSGDKLVLDAAVEVDAMALRVAGVLLGQRILLLSWDGSQLTEQREPVVPQALQGRAILRDLQLVYWPAAAVRAALPRGWQLQEQAARRRLLRGATVVFESERGDAAPLGNASLWNHVGQYRIDIESSNESR
jgi:hypothetical protein